MLKFFYLLSPFKPQTNLSPGDTKVALYWLFGQHKGLRNHAIQANTPDYHNRSIVNCKNTSANTPHARYTRYFYWKRVGDNDCNITDYRSSF